MNHDQPNDGRSREVSRVWYGITRDARLSCRTPRACRENTGVERADQHRQEFVEERTLLVG